MSAERHIKVFRVIDTSKVVGVDEKTSEKMEVEIECRRFRFDGTSFSELEKLVSKLFKLSSSAEDEVKVSLVYCNSRDVFGNRINPFSKHKTGSADDPSTIIISSDKDLAAAWSASILDKEEDPTVWEAVDDVGNSGDTNTIRTIDVLRLQFKT